MKKIKMLFSVLLFLSLAILLSACTGSSTLNNATSWPGLSADGSVVYLTDGTTVQAVQDGVFLWQYPSAPNNKTMFYATPLTTDDKVIVGTYEGQVHMLNKADGTLIKMFSLANKKGKIIAAPAIFEDTMIVAEGDGIIIAYKIAGGTDSPLWETKIDGEAWITPVIFDDTVFVPSMNKKIYLLSLADGTLKKAIDIDGAMMTNPLIENEKMYFSILSKQVFSFDLKTNEVAPIMKTDGEIWGAPLILSERLIIADMSGNIYCSDMKSGEVLWSLKSVAGEKVGFIASPIALDESQFAVIAENGELKVFDLDGKSIQERSTSAKSLTSPVLCNQQIVSVFMNGDSKMKAYSFDLKEAWKYSAPAPSPTQTATKAEK